jgi:alkylation response protein AidB-like acyl-CoA dehydrogenase
MALSDLGMKLALRGLNGFAGLGLLDRINLREPAERLIYRGARDGTRVAATAGRTFSAASKRAKPARTPKAKSRGLFDLTPTDEQEMLRDSFRQFAADKLRKQAPDADAKSEAPPELMSQASELGITMLGVPEEMGGVFEESSSISSVLIAETLAHGDMGLAVGALAPAAVSTAIGLWGDENQQAKYLPPFVSEDVPAAAFALIEPHAVFDPLHLKTTARPTDDGGFVLNGIKSLVPRADEAELFVVAADLEGGKGPALFIIESKTEGIAIEDDPAMGLRAAATKRLILEDVTLESGAIIAAGAPEVYRECVQRSRLAWCALAVGTAQAVLDYVIPYTNERVAFGEPISNRQAVAFAVADIGIELEGMRLSTYRAASRADQGLDFAKETTLARLLCSEKGMKIGSDGVGLLGGHGFVKEHPVERWYRDLRAAGLMEGALLV